MNPDPLEQLLEQQPLRAAPGAWRDEILAAARASAGTTSPGPPRTSPADLLRHWLWPHPVAWVGLATCWTAIFVLSRAAAPSPAEMARERESARVAAVYWQLLSSPAVIALTTGAESQPPRTEMERPTPGFGGREHPVAHLPA